MAKFYKKEEIQKYQEFLEEYLILKGVNTNKLIKCFSKEHEDKNPSMSFYKKKNTCTCFACGEKYNIFKLVGQEYGLTKFIDQIKMVEKLYKNRDLIKNINEGIYSQKNAEVIIEKNIKIDRSKENKEEDIDYKKYIYDCSKALSKDNYFSKRGISEEVQKKYYLGFDKNFKLFPAIIIPTDFGSYTARNINPESKIRYSKVGKAAIFNYWELKTPENKNKEFYITEGEIDALSLIEVGKKAVALCSVNNENLFLKKLAEDMPQNKFHILLDNDEVGKNATEKLYKGMKELGLNVQISKILGNYKDVNEFLMKDRKGLESKINNLEITSSWNQKLNQTKSNGISR
ncbi:MAG: toprim domain-containing protein [Fusobacterium sp.]|nr:toprim domain-containing protein [Fusobacterium sp.]